MYLPGKILKTGKAWNPDYPVANATAEAWVIDMNQVSPSWRQVQSMAFPRTQHQLTVLPDGSVLATGGARNSDVNDTANAVLAAELWDPLTETWRTLSSGAVPRLYHSSATLLPDGRVEVSGGGHPPGFGIAEFRSEIFSPPYLFKGARPTISSAPSQANYGQNFFVATPDGSSITKVALIPQPTPTHAFNSNSGYMPLTFSQTAGGLTVTAPSNGNIAPPGMYMMFVDQRQRRAVRCVVGPRLRGGSGEPHRQAHREARQRVEAAVEVGERPTSAPTPPAPTPSAPTSIFPSLTPGAAAPGESIGSYGKRIVCTLNRNRDSSRTALKRGPP